MFTLEFKVSSLLNLRENNGILATSSNGKMIEIKIKNWILVKSNNFWYFSINGRAAINIPTAGVGKPIKEVFCSELMLNFAKRIAEKIGIRSAIKAGKNKDSWKPDWKNLAEYLK